jgi:hypothetical protein
VNGFEEAVVETFAGGQGSRHEVAFGVPLGHQLLEGYVPSLSPETTSP